MHVQLDSITMGKIIWTIIVCVVAFWLMIEKQEDFNWDELAGKYVIVTGASSGIGEEIAYVLAKFGANVLITARRESRLKKVVNNCKKLSPNGNFFHAAADMSNISHTKHVIDIAASVFGRIDMLILNHALVPDFANWIGSAENLTFHDKIMEVNYRSFVYLASYALPYLEKTNGSIGAVGSIAGRMPSPWLLPYSASKFAMDGFFTSLRWEFIIRGINVSTTYCIIGRIGTEKSNDVMNKFFKEYEADSAVMDKLYPAATAETAAAAIVQATYSRERELIYPNNQNIFISSALRILWPSLLENNLDYVRTKYS